MLESNQSDARRDIWIGISDGLSIPFALLSGLSVLLEDPQDMLFAGWIVVGIGSLTMGVGGYLIGRAEHNHYIQELQEAASKEMNAHEISERRAYYANLGMDENLQWAATKDLEEEKNNWLTFITKYELMPTDSNPVSIRNSALRIGGSYCIGGSIPVVAYALQPTVEAGFLLSILFTLPCLFISGYAKPKEEKENAWANGLQTVFIAAIAAALLYFVAHLF